MTTADLPHGDGSVPGGQRLHGRFYLALVALTCAVVVAVHFRPWQDGLLEDWGLARAWQTEGWHGLLARVPSMAGRPLHLVPHYLGMLLSDGGFVGPFAVLAAVTVAQVLAALWALRPLFAVRMLRLALAALVALHPLWPAGDVLRFLPAQVSVLGLLMWLGAALRLLDGGRRAWVGLLAPGLLLGLLHYQAMLGTAAVAAVAIALSRPAPRRRRLLVVGVTWAVVVADLAWTLVVAPRLSASSYEAGLGSGGLAVLPAVRAVGGTLLRHGLPTVLAGAAIAGVALVGALRRRVRPQGAGAVLLAVAAAPVTALVYASQPLHLHDPERVVLPVSVTLWVALVLFVAALTETLPGRADAAQPIAQLAAWPTAVVTFALAGAAVAVPAGYHAWTEYAAAQQSLLNGLLPRLERSPARPVVVADLTGRFGDVYTLLPPHVDLAAEVMAGEAVDVQLCTPAGVVRDQPVAARYPIGTTPDCGALLDGHDWASPELLTTTEGVVEVYAGRP